METLCGAPEFAVMHVWSVMVILRPAVQNAELYGSGVCITKFECVGQVQKRVGHAFITLSKNPPIEIVEIVVKKAVRLEKPLRDALPWKLFLP